MDEQKIITALKTQGLLPLFYHDDSEVCLSVTMSLYRAGIRSIEFTNRGKNAFANFSAIVSERDRSMKDLVLGAGTIRDGSQANAFMDAGADFLVSPVFDAEVCDAAYLRKVLWIPGCMTATEIHVAVQAGCRLIKLFPGNILGPAFVSAIRPLFPGIEFMPTGGVDVTKENLNAWFGSGVIAVGMGSKLINNEILEGRDYASLQTTAQELLTTISSIRKQR